MELDIRTVVGGPLEVNTYVVGLPGSEHCVRIDPGAQDVLVAEAVQDRIVDAVLLTHGHFDHILYAAHWLEKGARLYVHEGDADMIRQPHLNMAVFVIRQGLRLPDADVKHQDGSVVREAGLELTVLHTPGHTPGSVCYRMGSNLFSGDTLFYNSYGRTDLPGGDDEQMEASLKRLMGLEDDVICYPGHGTKTKIAWERGNYA